MKVTISLDDNVLKRIDDYAKKNGVKRSGLISIACMEYLDAKDSLKAVEAISLVMRQFVDNSDEKLDDKTFQEFEDFERMVRLLRGRE